MKKQETERKIPLRNYFILTAIILITFVSVTYLVMLYADNQKKEPTLSLASTLFSEINSNEISAYLLENPNTIIYFASSKDDLLTFEDKLDDFVMAYYIKDKFVYLDTSKISDINFYDKVYKNYFSNNLKQQVSSFGNYPNMIYINDGKISDLLYKKETEPNILDVKAFLIENDIILEND